MKTLIISLALGAVACGVGLEPLVKGKEILESDVKLSFPTKVKLNGGSFTKPLTLYLTGHGIREKKVVLAWVNVYALASYTNLPNGLNPEKPMESLKEAKIKALEMTFLRDVDGDKITTSFREALEENKVNVKSGPLAELLSQIKFDLKKGEKVTLVGWNQPDGSEKLLLQAPQTLLVQEGKGFLLDFWKIWFGNPSDSGLEKLKPQLSSK